MSNLWTPWRMTYLRGDAPMSDGCLFCAVPHEPDAQVHMLHRGQLCYVILNRYPYNNGHLMIVPYAHLASVEDMDSATTAEFMRLTQISLQVLRAAYQPQGFNVGANIGEAAGAGIAGHVHLHVVPRWGGDTSYLTVVGQTRTIPEWLDQTYQRLQPLFEQAMCNLR